MGVLREPALKWCKENVNEGRPIILGAMIYDSAWTREATDIYFPRISEFIPGVKYVGCEVIPFLGCIDTTTEWLRLARKTPDWVWMGVCGASLVTALKDSYRLEIQKKGINLLTLALCPDEVILRVAGEAGDGIYQHATAPLAHETALPGLSAILESAKKYRGYEQKDVTRVYIQGWLDSMVQCEGIRLAIEQVGLENLNGRAVRDALATMTNFQTGVTPPITMSNDRPFWGTKVRVDKVKDSTPYPVSDWMEPLFTVAEK